MNRATRRQYCKDCKKDTMWSRGIALINRWLVSADFRGDFSGTLEEAMAKGIDVTGQTMSASGPPYIANAMKCTECGKSITD